MPRFKRRQSHKAGFAPGTLIHIGEKKLEQPRITLMDYDEQALKESEIAYLEDTFPFKDIDTTTWINIDGLHDVSLIEKIGQQFNIHPLTMEDILNTGQRPKFEDYEHYVYMVMPMIQLDEENIALKSEQISIILGSTFLISFQEAPGDVFSPVRERIRKGKTRVRKNGCDYLAYALVDAIVDNYFIILEKVGDRIELLEDRIITNPKRADSESVHELKSELIYLRKQIWPMREMINSFIRGESSLVKQTTHFFLRDLYDHTIQTIDTIETYRDLLSGLLDLYLSTISNKMNEIMKVLTMIATIFIPITSLAGIYGMNFKYMPELEWKWGYLAFWVVIVLVTVGMLFYFKRKKWL